MPLQDGTYYGESISNSGRGYRIRIDMGRERTPWVEFQLISGDIFRVSGGATLIDSFRGEGVPTISADGNVISVGVRTFSSNEAGVLTLSLSSAGALSGRLQGAGVGLATGTGDAFDLGPENPGYLRELACQIDLSAGAASPMDGWYRFNGNPVTVDSCLRDAGVLMTVEQQTSISDPPQEWPIDLLRSEMSRRFTLVRQGIVPDIYLLIATRYRDDRDTGQVTTGIMFDVDERRGAAVFHDTLVHYYGGDFWRNYIRTTVHEIGHTFNLPHAADMGTFADRGISDPTFMNYPWAFGGGPDRDQNIINYWNAFQFRFSRGEQLRLAHGPFRGVIMGGEPYRGQSADLAMGPSPSIPNPEGLRLGITFEPEPETPIFEFGAPVHVEVRLTNVSRDERVVHDALAPEFGLVTFLIRKPSGQVIRYEHPYERSVEPDFRALSADAPRLHVNACLSFSRDGFTFIDPGRYQIQAIYPSRTGPIASNILPLYVRHPSREQEDEIVPLLDPEVCAYMAMHGSWYMKEEIDRRLKDFVEPYEPPARPRRKRARRAGAGPRPDLAEAPWPPSESTPGRPIHPLAFAIWRCRARMQARGKIGLVNGRRVGPDVPPESPDPDFLCKVLGLELGARGQIRARDPRVAPIVADGGKSPSVSPFSNLINGDLFTMLIRSLADVGTKAHLKAAIRYATAYLDAQKVKADVMDSLRRGWGLDP